MNNQLRAIISGGGTGGHIFPAISIANAVRAMRPDAEILFVGALGRMEMQRVPAAGYAIEGLPICGFDRKRLWRNVAVFYRIWKSQRLAREIIRKFRPSVAVGVGGYASGPTLNQCAAMGIPCLLQEQNSYAGVTNKLLAKKAAKICVAYEGMERFFPKEKMMLTGNPVRQNLLDTALSREDAIRQFGLNPEKKTILLADGNPQNRAFLESLLRINYNLLLAEDGEQAIELLDEHENNISLALIEADLPKLDGFKIIQKFQENMLLFYFQFLFEVIIESRWQEISLSHLGFDLQLFSGVKSHHSCRVLSRTE